MINLGQHSLEHALSFGRRMAKVVLHIQHGATSTHKPVTYIQEIALRIFSRDGQR